MQKVRRTGRLRRDRQADGAADENAATDRARRTTVNGLPGAFEPGSPRQGGIALFLMACPCSVFARRWRSPSNT